MEEKKKQISTENSCSCCPGLEAASEQQGHRQMVPLWPARTHCSHRNHTSLGLAAGRAGAQNCLQKVTVCSPLLSADEQTKHWSM